MSAENEWAKIMAHQLQAEFQQYRTERSSIKIRAHYRLPYLNEITRYFDDESEHGRPDTLTSGYQTDLLLSEHFNDGTWIPRVVIECKYGAKISSHDALTYSSKAMTHKQVHPYLRYGILLGNFTAELPYRLLRHGSYFDFMCSWVGEQPDQQEKECF